LILCNFTIAAILRLMVKGTCTCTSNLEIMHNLNFEVNVKNP
jgi:hypothetical protein